MSSRAGATGEGRRYALPAPLERTSTEESEDTPTRAETEELATGRVQRMQGPVLAKNCSVKSDGGENKQILAETDK